VNEEQLPRLLLFWIILCGSSNGRAYHAFEEEFKDEIKGEIPESDAEKLRRRPVIDYIKAKAGTSEPLLVTSGFCLFPSRK